MTNTKNILDELNNESNKVINDLTKRSLEEAVEKQREEDRKADKLDTTRGTQLMYTENARKAREQKDADLKESKGAVLVNGTPQNKFKKPALDPERMGAEAKYPYLNWPIKEIDSVPVVLIGAVPFYNKECTWDENYRHLSEHFTLTDHPNYHNAVYCKIRYTDLYKKTYDAWVIRTDLETQLWRERADA